MKKLMYLMLLAVGVTSCSVENAEQNEEGIQEINLLTYGDPENTSVACGATVTWPFGTMAHGYVEAKIVAIFDVDYLSVQIIAGPEKSYNQSRVEVATEAAYFPLKGGGLPPGQIQERNNDDNSPYLFPLSLFGTDCEIFIAAWAIITPGGSEADHWAGNLEFVMGKPNKGLYFAYCFECEQDDPGDICESAYMATSTTINTWYGVVANTNTNWGWYYHYTGGTNGDDVTFPLYAAAGQNILSKGTHVGNVTVNSLGETNVVMFTGYSYSNLHVFVSDSRPPKRPAPGQFKNYSETMVDGNFYIIVHAEVCW